MYVCIKEREQGRKGIKVIFGEKKICERGKQIKWLMSDKRKWAV